MQPREPSICRIMSGIDYRALQQNFSLLSLVYFVYFFRFHLAVPGSPAVITDSQRRNVDRVLADLNYQSCKKPNRKVTFFYTAIAQNRVIVMDDLLRLELLSALSIPFLLLMQNLQVN